MSAIMNSPQKQDRVVRLAVAVKRLRARLQEAALAGTTSFSLAQLSILRRLRLEGPMTAASLATAEHVSQQAIAQNLSEMKRTGLVEAAADPQDGRKRLISVTESGNGLFDSASASRNAWLADTIDSTVTDSELPALDKAIELLERLADGGHSDKSR